MAAGDASAMATFVRRYQARVYGLALKVVKDSGLAEEVAQDAFMRAWRYAATYDARRGQVGTWLLTITRNLSVDAARLRRDFPVDPEQLIGHPGGRDRGARLRGRRADAGGTPGLPAEQARPVVLAAVYGLTAQEIADREGIPLGTAKTRIRRGLARLRHELAASVD